MKNQAKPVQGFSVGGSELFLPHPDAPQKCADCPDKKCVFRFNSEDKPKGRYNLARAQECFQKCTYHTDSDVMTNQSAIIRYSDNTQGVFPIIFYEWNDEQRNIMIHGTNGLLSGDLKSGVIELKKFREDTHEIFEAPGGMHGDGDYWLIKSFFNAVNRHTQPDATARDGILASKIAFAANLSAAEHRVVELSEFSAD